MNTAPARQMAVPTILATLLKLLISTFSNLREPNKKKSGRLGGNKEFGLVRARSYSSIQMAKWAVLDDIGQMAPVVVQTNAKCWAQLSAQQKGQKWKENKIERKGQREKTVDVRTR